MVGGFPFHHRFLRYPGYLGGRVDPGLDGGPGFGGGLWGPGTVQPDCGFVGRLVILVPTVIYYLKK